MGIELDTIKVSKVCSDKRGTWWAIGTNNEYFEFWVTPGGKFRLLGIKKQAHPYFTFKKPRGK